jgi:alpha-D-ribose 1-methylphosphonate 5-triphosphate synthase subunit PhnG
MQRLSQTPIEHMSTTADRTERFERIAGCDGDRLADLADAVLASGSTLAVVQEPRPQLCLQRVREPVERRPINIGEVVVTPAEVELDGARGFAMVPGKAERAALSGAIVDAAVAGDHEQHDAIVDELAAAAEKRAAERQREYAESRHTTVEFETMEDEL